MSIDARNSRKGCSFIGGEYTSYNKFKDLSPEMFIKKKIYKLFDPVFDIDSTQMNTPIYKYLNEAVYFCNLNSGSNVNTQIWHTDILGHSIMLVN